MKLFKVCAPIDGVWAIQQEVYVICDTFGEAEDRFLEKFPNKTVARVSLVADTILIKGESDVHNL